MTKASPTLRPPRHEAAAGLQAELRDQRAMLEGIIGSAIDAIISVDEDQRITLFNPAAERMFRYRADEVLGRPLEMLLPERFRAEHRAHIARFGDTGVGNRHMRPLRPLAALRKGGEEFPIEATISQVIVGGSRPKKLFTAIVRDISTRYYQDQALREAESRFHAVFEHARLGIVLTDPQGVLLEVNPEFQRILGRGVQELIGRSYLELVHRRDAAEAARHLVSIREGRPPAPAAERRFVRQDGRIAWCRVIKSPVLSGGQLRFLVGLIEDITEQKRALAKAARARARHAAVIERMGRLTEREREVMWLVVAGKPSKVIAADLGASPKTIEVHRARIMEKLKADSLAQLVRMAMSVKKYVAPAPSSQART